jgi:uncharacterized protein YkwD
MVAVALLAAMPSGATAAEGCAFQQLKATDKNLDRVEHSLFCLTNLHRVRNGVATLKIDTRLATAARAHSADMTARGFFDHTTPEGLDPSERAAAFGYPFGAGENIATNTEGTALKLFQQWRDSPPHNQNMLGGNYPAAGMGASPHCCPAGGSGVTGTQMFGVGPADTDDDALDYYASSNKCVRATEDLILKREARKRARKQGKREKAQALGAKIREIKRYVKQRCKQL